MKTLEETKKMYFEMMKALKKYKGLCVFDVDELERKSKIHIYGLELKEKYGLNIKPEKINAIDYNSFGEFKKVGWFGEKYRRTISWSVDGRQPNDELLFTVSFPTGAFIFGDGSMFNKDYPTDFFKKFWLELKTYKPDYIDEVNHGLYWKIENAKDAFNSFDDVLGKYHELNREDIKQRRIQKMKEDLAKLENAK
jgi:hypothetical protein